MVSEARELVYTYMESPKTTSDQLDWVLSKRFKRMETLVDALARSSVLELELVSKAWLQFNRSFLSLSIVLYSVLLCFIIVRAAKFLQNTLRVLESKVSRAKEPFQLIPKKFIIGNQSLLNKILKGPIREALKQ